jgi:hypothetical protein
MVAMSYASAKKNAHFVAASLVTHANLNTGSPRIIISSVPVDSQVGSLRDRSKVL